MTDPREPSQALAAEIGWQPALERTDLLGAPAAAALERLEKSGPDGAELARQAQVVEIDPRHSDTEVLNRHYRLDPRATGNCVLVAGRRSGQERVAACVVRATDLADVNHVVKRLLDVRKASFLPVERAVEMSGMEYGGITPVGLPQDWRLFIDSAVAERETVLIGSGVRHSKLLVAGGLLAALPGAEVVTGLGLPQ
ncbi:MAG: YbaK/EbsC family protein [Actinomyces sp.]|uniref:YbaK/EbsC family protein n=1 Tax=Actinomyces sp. TaxID=29317 RepID=UPI0026DC62E7|nr:YbaK/EbsC family protein [Actinomyces sp.]MDO4243435.1 YbaK/EbsC family protein [Actinomyces sp.]